MLSQGQNHLLYSEGDTPLLLSADGDAKQYKKDMIKLGVYIHPIHKWKLNVTEDRLYRWLTNFKAMRTNGVDVEVPLDHSFSAEKNLGYVVDAMVEKDSQGVLTLFGILEVKGDQANNVIERNKNVSVWISENYTDGKGNFYGEVIKHCSVVQQPVMPQQEPFVSIAASMQGAKDEKIPIYFLGSNNMKKELLEQFKKLFGLEDSITEETLFSTIEKQIQTKTEEDKKTQESLLSLRTQLEKANAKAASMGQEDKGMDANTLELVGSTMSDKLELLVTAGKITPAVAKTLSAALIGAQGSRNEKALSLGDNQSASLASQVIDALKENDALKLKEQTGAQVLSQQNPDETEVKADEDAGKAMAAGAGVDEEKKKD
jgi:transcriptional regulator of NAD metabolism